MPKIHTTDSKKTGLNTLRSNAKGALGRILSLNYHNLQASRKNKPGHTPNTINGIYFTKDGSLPPCVVNNLTEMSSQAAKVDFATVFWTDVERLNNEIIEKFSTSGVIVKDYRKINATLDETIHKFVTQGHSGDICAYVLASDILRIAIVDSLPVNDIFIYADCNDIKFLNLASDLQQLAVRFQDNQWGLSFPINILHVDEKGSGTVELRNDRIIIRKANNPVFIQTFMKMYVDTVIKKAPLYQKTEDNNLKKKQADEISCFVTCVPFQVLINTINFVLVRLLGYDGFPVTYSEIDFASYFNCKRSPQYANTWRKAGDAEIVAVAKLIDKSIFNSKDSFIDSLSNLYSKLECPSLTEDHPFKNYQLNVVYIENDGTYIVRDYLSSLWKIFNYGTDNVRCENIIFDIITNQTHIYNSSSLRKDIIDKIKEHIENSISSVKEVVHKNIENPMCKEVVLRDCKTSIKTEDHKTHEPCTYVGTHYDFFTAHLPRILQSQYNPAIEALLDSKLEVSKISLHRKNIDAYIEGFIKKLLLVDYSKDVLECFTGKISNEYILAFSPELSSDLAGNLSKILISIGLKVEVDDLSTDFGDCFHIVFKDSIETILIKIAETLEKRPELEPDLSKYKLQQTTKEVAPIPAYIQYKYCL